MRRKAAFVVYSIIFFAVCLCPFLGMAVMKQETSSENRTLAEFPVLFTEDGFNTQWPEQAGEYFQDHFAFRSELVTANALLSGKLLGVSTASGVICGEDGWLFYSDSLPDYLGSDLMSDRSLFNLAHSLAMVQENLEQRGVRFLFTVAPNKNSLYGEYMPYYDSLKVSEENNRVRLKAYLEQEGVAYADLFAAFDAEDEILYHRRDSHWNNKGAALAADVMMTALGQEHDSYEDETYQVRADFEGDLDQMLYPLAMQPEEEIYYDKMTTFAYVGEVESNFEPRITTVNPVKTGSLVMYRDSFANALLPFLADAYASAYFTRGLPWMLGEVDTMAADTVIIECAERFLPDRAALSPQMEASRVLWDGTVAYSVPEEEAVSDLELVQMGTLFQITGRIREEYLETDTEIYIRINGTDLYEAFPVDVKTAEGTDAGGFSLWLSADSMCADGSGAEILIRNGDTLSVIAEKTLTMAENPVNK